MLWLGLMALGALLLLSCGARRAENLKREQAELKREQAAFLASRCDFRRASGRCDSSYKPKASKPALAEIAAHLVAYALLGQMPCTSCEVALSAS